MLLIHLKNWGVKIKGYILVHTTSSAFKFEKLLKLNKVKMKLVPTPRKYSSDCGISVYFETDDEEFFNKLLTESNIEHKVELNG